MGVRFSRDYKKNIVLKYDDTDEVGSPKRGVTPFPNDCDNSNKVFSILTGEEVGVPLRGDTPEKKPSKGCRHTRKKKKRPKKIKKHSRGNCDRCSGEGFVPLEQVNPKNKRRCGTCLGTGLKIPCGLSKMWWNLPSESVSSD